MSVPFPYWLLIGLVAGINGPSIEPKLDRFPTLEACQNAAMTATELSRSPEALFCLHVDQVSQFSTVQGTWKNRSAMK
jgi:hypothetical protein